MHGESSAGISIHTRDYGIAITVERRRGCGDWATRVSPGKTPEGENCQAVSRPA
jgi:hypothetical protein